MGAAIALGERGRGRTAPNPNVGCVIVRDGRIAGAGWTQPGGRPHAEAMALAEAGAAARGAHVFVTLEPCCHESPRGPACADLLIAAGVASVTIAVTDPDPRMDGTGIARLCEAGIAVDKGASEEEARRSMAGFLARTLLGRPLVTLKLATSLDFRIALANGESRWITGAAARAHAHVERARSDAILVGSGTLRADDPRMDVRLEGLEDRSPRRLLLTRSGAGAQEWQSLASPEAIRTLEGVNDLLVEGGADTASAFLAADLVDRLLLYRAPILIGAGKPGIGDIGLTALPDAHGRWRLADSRTLGRDRLEVYERVRTASTGA